MMRYILLLFAGLTLAACSESGEQPVAVETQSETPKKTEDMIALDLSKYGSLKEIMVPARKTQGVDPSVDMDELSGFVSIHAGKSFQMILREEPTTLEDIRQELENELMWTNAVTPFEDHSMLIERSLPDGSMAQFHFASVLPGVGSNVVLRSDPMGDFSRKDAERMINSAITLKTQEGLAMNLR